MYSIFCTRENQAFGSNFLHNMAKLEVPPIGKNAYDMFDVIFL